MSEIIQEPKKISKEFAQAIIHATAEFETLHKDSENPYFSSRYATLSSIINAVRPVLHKYELTFIQPVVVDETRTIRVDTVLVHSSGQTLNIGSLAIPVEKPTAHGIGSAITYAKRYGLTAGLGLAISDETDDDGNAASINDHSHSKPTPKIVKPAVPVKSKQYFYEFQDLSVKQKAWLVEQGANYLPGVKVWVSFKDLGEKVEQNRIPEDEVLKRQAKLNEKEKIS